MDYSNAVLLRKFPQRSLLTNILIGKVVNFTDFLFNSSQHIVMGHHTGTESMSRDRSGGTFFYDCRSRLCRLPWIVHLLDFDRDQTFRFSAQLFPGFLQQATLALRADSTFFPWLCSTLDSEDKFLIIQNGTVLFFLSWVSLSQRCRVQFRKMEGFPSQR